VTTDCNGQWTPSPVDEETQAERDLASFTAKILGESATEHLTRTWREYHKSTKRMPNFGDVGRGLYEKFESELTTTQRFYTTGPQNTSPSWQSLVFKSAQLRPVGPGWFVRWRNL